MIESRLDKKRRKQDLNNNKYKKWLFELVLVYLILASALVGLYYVEPTFTAFITAGKQFNYNDTLSLEFNESSEYIWNVQNQGKLKSVKISGLIESKGSARVYLEANNSLYLIFDSNKLNEKAALDSITGFVAAQGRNKTKPNKPPTWNSSINSFIVNESLSLDLNNYFEDKDGDFLKYSYTDIIDLEIFLENSILTISNANNLEKNETLELTASDNETSKKKNIVLVLIKKIIINETPIINITPTNITNETINITPIINETQNITVNKSININLEYNADSVYDENNDGVESTTGIVDLTVKNTKFNWDAEENLCTRWETYSVENKESTIVCYGSQNCCNFIGLQPTRANWSETFYSYYGLYGATENNLISAQVLHVDYNLSIEAPYSDIVYSSWKNLSAIYYEGLIRFDNICVESCLLPNLNQTSYKLIIEINNTLLKLNEINYIVEKDVENIAPVLIKNISNITIIKNKNYSIDLNEYFTDLDDDLLLFNYYKGIENISVTIENNVATLIPDKGFVGTKYLFFTANDSISSTVSNVFPVNVEESKFLSASIQIGKPVKQQKRITIENIAEKTEFNLSLPATSTNLSIKNIKNQTVEDITTEKLEIIYKGNKKNKEKYEKEKELEKLKRKLSLLKEAKDKRAMIIIDENVYYEEIDDKINNLQQEESGLEQELSQELVSIVEEPKDNVTIVVINDTFILSDGEEIQVEYYTGAPIAIDRETPTGKTIEIISDTHYENVLAYTSIKETRQENIKLFWIVNNTKILFNDINYVDLNNNNLIDKIEWLVPYLSNQTFEVELTIINVQSFPTVGGNWTVRFTTSGTGNLTITASNGTSYSELYIDDEITINDLELLELKCDNNVLFNKNNLTNENNVYLINESNEKIKLNETLNENLIIKSLYVEDYSCDNLTAYHTVKVLTEGTHTQQFNFSGVIAYANNLATVNVTTPGNQFIDFNATQFNLGNFTNTSTDGWNVTLNKNGSNQYPNTTGIFLSQVFYPNKTVTWDTISWNDALNNKYGQDLNDLINASLVLLFHFNNDSSVGELYNDSSNGSIVFDYSNYFNNGTTNSSKASPPQFTASGKFGGAFSFDGKDDYIEVNDSPSLDIADSFTLEAWVNIRNLTKTKNRIISKGVVNGTNVTINVSSYNVRFYGIDSGDEAKSVSSGDFNNDGFIDVIIGAYIAEPTGGTDQGEVYVIYGPLNSSRDYNLSTANVTYFGIDASDSAGTGVGSGDFNNDGVDDFLIGADAAEPSGGTNQGEAYIIYGPINASGRFNLSTANVTIFGILSGSRLGSGVSSGDFNNDGIEDLIIGASGAANVGEAYLIYGPLNDTGTFNISSIRNATYNGANIGDEAGKSVGSGDLNNDGIDDFIVGGKGVTVVNNEGQIYIVYGPTPVSVSSCVLKTTCANLTLTGANIQDNAGDGVGSIDFNNDGIDDLMIGAREANAVGGSNGEAYIISGPLNQTGTINNLSKSTNITFIVIDSNDGVGSGIGSGDFNNDGIDDVLIGANAAEPPGGSSQGEVYIIYGPKQLQENYNLMISEKGAAVFSFQNSSGKIISVKTDNKVVTENAFHHIAGVVDLGNNEMRIYVDGIEKASKAFSGTPTINNQSVTIGAFKGGLGSNINGTIDEVAIWNVSLAESEIADHYKRGVLKLNLSYRTSDDNVTFTSYTGVSNSTVSSIGVTAKYFQYRANFTTNDTSFTPYLENVTINYTTQSLLKIYDDTDSAIRVVTQIITFTANFTDPGGISINGSGVNCTFSHNLTGTFSAAENMTFDKGDLVYEINKTFAQNSVNLSYYNVTCDGTALGGDVVSALDQFVVNPSLNITLTLTPSIVFLSNTFTVSGHINLSNGTNVSNNFIQIALNKSLVNITSIPTLLGQSFIDKDNNDFNLGNFTNTTTDGANVTLLKNGSNQYPNTTGIFISKVFNYEAQVNFTYISWNDALNDKYNKELDDLINASLVLLMHFNNDSSVGELYNDSRNGSIVFDYSTYQTNGTTNSSNGLPPQFTPSGIFSGAFDFVKNSYIEVNDSPTLDIVDSFTLEAWVNVKNLSKTKNRIITKAVVNGTNPSAINLSTNDVVFVGKVSDGNGGSGDDVDSGDFNNDGFNDLIIGAPFAESSGGAAQGETYIIYGPINNSGSYNPLTENVTFFGKIGGDRSGTGVGSGDFNNDGILDIIIGASFAEPAEGSDQGEAYIIYGLINSSGSYNLSTANVTFFGRDASDNAGTGVGSGDFNNDGIDDVIIGAENADPNSGNNEGETYIIYGPINESGSYNLSISNVTFRGIDANDLSGHSAASGDFNNDGIDDVVIGARGAEPDATNSLVGETYIIYGPINGSGSYSLSTANVTFFGIDANDQAGYDVDSGDFNNDGIDDVIIGAWFAEPTGGSSHGEAYIIFGQINLTGTYNISSIANMTFFGKNAGDIAGSGVDSGDLNNDGIDDILIAARAAQPQGETSEGETYIIYGPQQLIENYNLMVDEKGAAILSFQNSSGEILSLKTSNNLITTNAFHHIAGVVDTGNNEMKIYVDGVEKASKAFSGAPTINNQSVTIGAFKGGLGSNINGTIDEVAIWNTTLSENEIADHYKRGVLDLNISYRTSDDNVTFTSYTPVDNSTLSAVSVIAQYFQYKAELNTTDVLYTPYLFNITINHSGTFTDRFGNYSYTLTALSTAGNYEVKINTTYPGLSGTTILGEKNATLEVLSLDLNITLDLSPSAVVGSASFIALGHINLTNNTNVSNNLIRIFLNKTEQGISQQFIDDDDTDFNLGNYTNTTTDGENVTLNRNGSNQYPNQTGIFISQTFTKNTPVNFTFISWNQEAPYQKEIGRASNDGNDASSPYINTSGLILLLHFNNETGLENDSLVYDFSVDVNSERSGPNINGTINGSHYNLTNKVFGAASMEFDGERDYINISASNNALNLIGTEVTVACWFYAKTLRNAILCGKSISGANNYLVYLSGTNLAGFIGTTGETSITGSELSINTWYHGALTYNGTNMTLYLNGNIDASKEKTGNLAGTDSEFTVGGRDGTGFDFNGSIDEVAVWNRSLSPREIKDLYRRGILTLNLSYRTSDDNVTWTSYTPVDNSTLSPVNVKAKYFQYRAKLNTTDVNYTPKLQNVTINYSGTFTDSFGDYNYTLTAPSTEGTYEVKVNTTFASISNEKNATLSVDISAPNVTLSFPANNSFTNLTNINFTWTAKDSVDTSLICNLTIDNIVNASNIASAHDVATNFTARGLTTDATYTWNVTCIDDIGNSIASVTFNFTIDTTFPTIRFSSPTLANATFVNQNYIFVNVSFTEVNVNNVTFYLYDNNLALINETNITTTDVNASINITRLADGAYYYNATIRDKASNINSTDTRNITLDTTFPTIRFSGGTENNDTFFSRNFIFINASFTEINFNNITFYLYDSNLALINETNYTGITDNNASVNITGLADGAYYYNATVRDKASNINSTDARNITLDTTFPKISFSNPTEPNYANKSQSFIFINVSITEANAFNLTFYLYDSLLNLINETNFTNIIESNASINITGLSEGSYYYNATVIDIVSHVNSTETRNITLDITAPNVTFKAPTPANSTVAGPNVEFNWTATDNLAKTLKCYPTIDGTLQTSFQTPNGTYSNTTLTLTGGNHTITVTCFDDANNSNTSEKRKYTVGIINITIPNQDEIMRPKEKFRFNVSIIAGADWVTNVTLIIFNESFEAKNFTNTTYNFTYTVINITPKRVNATAYAYNKATGPGENITSQIQLRIARAADTTTSPAINLSCSNETYTLNKTNITIITRIDLDTLLEKTNVSILLPNGSLQLPAQLMNSSNETELLQFFNYTYVTTSLQGHNTIILTAIDIENQSIEFNSTFHVSNFTKGINITKINSNLPRLKDVCTGLVLFNASSYTLPNISYYDVEIFYQAAIIAEFFNASFYEGNNTFQFTQLTTQTAAPSGQRRIDMFDLKSEITHNNLTLTYNYSSIAHTITTESNLDIYSCNASSCSSSTWDNLNATLDTANNIITVPGLRNITRRFIVTETSGASTPAPVILNLTVARGLIATNTSQNISLSFNISGTLSTVTLAVNGTLLTATNTSNVSEMVYYYNYTYNATAEANYTVEANVTDTAAQKATKSITFFAAPEEIFNLSATGTLNLTLKDSITGKTISIGSVINSTLPRGQYNVEVKTSDNKTGITILNATLNTSLRTILTYKDLDETLTAPSNRTNLDQFEVNSTAKFVQMQFVYNYTNLTADITDEDNLEVYKCNSTASCSFSEIPATIDTSLNTITFISNNLSVFNIVESIKTVTETVTETVTTTVSSGGGGGGGGGGSIVTRVASLDLIVPSPITLRLNDSVTIPLILRNTGQVDLKDITLSTEVNAEGISVELDQSYVNELEVDESVSVDMTLNTNIEEEGRYEIDITATAAAAAITADKPEVKNTAKLIIDVTERNQTVTVTRIVFAKDLFKENPECLELQELLDQADDALDEGDYLKAKDLTEAAINGCRDLISSMGKYVEVPGKALTVSRLAGRISIMIALAILVAMIVYKAITGTKLKIRRKRIFKSRKQGKPIRLFKSFRRKPKKAVKKETPGEAAARKDIESLLKRGP